MADFTDVLLGRRSIRRYEEREVPDQLLNQVLEAVRWSPSWANTQCWEVVVVRDAETKLKLRDTLGKGNPAVKAVAEAPLVLAVCGKLESSGWYGGQPATKLGDWFMFDLGIAAQSLCLAARNAGLGTVIVGLFDHNAVKEILQAPPGYEVVVLIPLGFPAKEGAAPKRRETGEFTHYGKF